MFIYVCIENSTNLALLVNLRFIFSKTRWWHEDNMKLVKKDVWLQLNKCIRDQFWVQHSYGSAKSVGCSHGSLPSETLLFQWAIPQWYRSRMRESTLICMLNTSSVRLTYDCDFSVLWWLWIWGLILMYFPYTLKFYESVLTLGHCLELVWLRCYMKWHMYIEMQVTRSPCLLI